MLHPTTTSKLSIRNQAEATFLVKVEFVEWFARGWWTGYLRAKIIEQLLTDLSNTIELSPALCPLIPVSAMFFPAASRYA